MVRTGGASAASLLVDGRMQLVIRLHEVPIVDPGRFAKISMILSYLRRNVFPMLNWHLVKNDALGQKKELPLLFKKIWRSRSL